MEFYYIIIINRKSQRENYKDDFHIEKIITKEQVLEAFQSDFTFIESLGDKIIVTNDNSLLNKYIVAINIEEFKLLCKKDYDKRKIRINPLHCFNYTEEVYRYFQKILNGTLISANMSYEMHTSYIKFIEDYVTIEKYYGWKENKNFNYFKTPKHYAGRPDFREIFNFWDIEEASIEEMSKILNTDILKISRPGFNSFSWESMENNILKYFDSRTFYRFYIAKSYLDFLKANSNHTMRITTRLDKNYYIEYHVTGLIYDETQDTPFV